MALQPFQSISQHDRLKASAQMDIRYLPNKPLCPGCSPLSLESITKAGSIELSQNFKYLDATELLKELIRIPPVWLDIEQVTQARSSCALCNLLYKETSAKLRDDIKTLCLFQCKDLDGRMQSLWVYDNIHRGSLVKLHCHAVEESYASQHIEYRPISLPESETSMNRIRHWVRDCVDTHPDCTMSISGQSLTNDAPLPTRVLDIQRYPESIRLVITRGERAKYAALSYCWGGKSQLQTTRETLAENQKHIACERLPKTILDAVWVACELGLRYLWVDCLCIIQGDDDDFNEQCTLMASVYEQAYLVFAATSAENTTMGLFRRSPQATYIEVSCSSDDPTLGSMYFGLQRDPEDSIFESPLNKRGWVLQEHLFARRTLHFADNQLYWECKQKFVGEDNTNVTDDADLVYPTRNLLLYIIHGYKRLRDNPGARDEDDMNTLADVYSLWLRLVKYYSTRGLTEERDKLPAILSLSHSLESTLGPPIRFHQGLIIGVPHLELECLLWRAKSGARLRKPKVRRASSWSWIAVDQALDFMGLTADGRLEDHQVYFVQLKRYVHKQDLRILGFRPHQAPGLPSCDALLLDGVAIECFTSCPTKSHTLSQHEDNILTCVYTSDGTRLECELIYDLAEEHPSEFWLMPTCAKWQNPDAPSPAYCCLMVKEVENHPFKNSVFERVGVGLVFDARWFDTCKRRFMVLL